MKQDVEGIPDFCICPLGFCPMPHMAEQERYKKKGEKKMEMVLAILLGAWLVFAGVFYKVFVTKQFKMYRNCRQENGGSGNDAAKGGASA